MSALKVVIISNGSAWQHWHAECLRHLQQVPGVDLVLHIVPPSERNQKHHLPRRIARAKWSTMLYRFYRRRLLRSRALELVNTTAQLSKVPQLEVSVSMQGFSEYFPEQAISKLKELKPDVIIRLGFNILRGEILQIPKYGVWSFHHGDEEVFRGGPPGLWEIMKGERKMGAVLQRLTEQLDGGYILKKGFYPVIGHSLKDTVDSAMIDSAIWPAQICRRLLQGNEDAAQGNLSEAKGKLYRYPNNLAFLKFALLLWRNKLRFHREDLNKHEEWNIGLFHYPITEFLKKRPNRNVRWLPYPQLGLFRADPFGFIKNDELVVLYEKYDSKSNKGVIARVRPKPDNSLKRSVTVMEKTQHLSYPFILEHQGRILVIPECYESGRVCMYELSDDMNGLLEIGTLLERPLLDPTLVFYNEHWWLMGTLQPHTNVGLYLFYSKTLTGPYTAHAMNPVKSDIRSARPAGTPFIEEGVLYRPAQDSSETYGGEVVINKVLQLDVHDFREEEFTRVPAMPGSDHDQGIHTISRVSDSLTLIDGKRFVTHPNKRKERFLRKIRKVIRIR